MSDYARHLVERALGVGNAVSPRPVAIFEPAGASQQPRPRRRLIAVRKVTRQTLQRLEAPVQAKSEPADAIAVRRLGARREAESVATVHAGEARIRNAGVVQSGRGPLPDDGGIARHSETKQDTRRKRDRVAPVDGALDTGPATPTSGEHRTSVPIVTEAIASAPAQRKRSSRSHRAVNSIDVESPAVDKLSSRQPAESVDGRVRTRKRRLANAASALPEPETVTAEAQSVKKSRVSESTVADGIAPHESADLRSIEPTSVESNNFVAATPDDRSTASDLQATPDAGMTPESVNLPKTQRSRTSRVRPAMTTGSQADLDENDAQSQAVEASRPDSTDDGRALWDPVTPARRQELLKQPMTSMARATSAPSSSDAASTVDDDTQPSRNLPRSRPRRGAPGDAATGSLSIPDAPHVAPNDGRRASRFAAETLATSSGVEANVADDANRRGRLRAGHAEYARDLDALRLKEPVRTAGTYGSEALPIASAESGAILVQRNSGGRPTERTQLPVPTKASHVPAPVRSAHPFEVSAENNSRSSRPPTAAIASEAIAVSPQSRINTIKRSSTPKRLADTLDASRDGAEVAPSQIWAQTVRRAVGGDSPQSFQGALGEPAVLPASEIGKKWPDISDNPVPMRKALVRLDETATSPADFDVITSSAPRKTRATVLGSHGISVPRTQPIDSTHPSDVVEYYERALGRDDETTVPELLTYSDAPSIASDTRTAAKPSDYRRTPVTSALDRRRRRVASTDERPNAGGGADSADDVVIIDIDRVYVRGAPDVPSQQPRAPLSTNHDGAGLKAFLTSAARRRA